MGGGTPMPNGMLSLKGVNCGFCPHLGCSGFKTSRYLLALHWKNYNAPLFK